MSANSSTTNEREERPAVSVEITPQGNVIVRHDAGCAENGEDFDDELGCNCGANTLALILCGKRIGELSAELSQYRERLDCVREGDVWHGANGGFFSARTGDAYNTLDQALDAELNPASISTGEGNG